MSIVLVRHAQVHVEPAEPNVRWKLSEAGRVASQELGEVLAAAVPGVSAVVSSTEAKAVETAALIADAFGGVDRRSDARLGEVSRPWTEDHRVYPEAAGAYLTGAEPEGWEPHRSVIARFGAAMAEWEPVGAIAVSHGIALTLWLASVLPALDAPSFWSRLMSPDAWTVDADRATITRLTGLGPGGAS
jgi:broad specificity phosphatase PhoE